MNSTPSRPKLIIVLTALPPDPPTPMTLMRASYSCGLVGELDREAHARPPGAGNSAVACFETASGLRAPLPMSRLQQLPAESTVGVRPSRTPALSHSQNLTAAIAITAFRGARSACASADGAAAWRRARAPARASVRRTSRGPRRSRTAAPCTSWVIPLIAYRVAQRAPACRGSPRRTRSCPRGAPRRP